MQLKPDRRVLMLFIRAAALFKLAMLFLSSAHANEVLQDLESRTLRPGQLLLQPVEFNRGGGVRLEIRLIDAPDGASLLVNDSGRLMLQWAIGSQMADSTSLVIQARDFDTQAIVDTSVLVVQNGQSFEIQPGADVVEQDNTPVQESIPVEVSLEPLAGQIVSAGRAVSFRVNSSASDNQQPLISIDRIPRNASFEKNFQGGYTFFWQTSSRDQGEHRFRLTAVHPDNTAVTESRELTIVVGDPSNSRTFPAGTDDGEG